ncbi:hypothetical protein [Gellertiella hungarica]|uniref:Uncharacterized protein n=1 Tax=Gellertiella hungarica TaxID=1572859 RepID=A0A7W6J255_9HYPH|nr:hypothetical protein [Gellertiella hungarica]MBB4063401.1 hypothetical protein [Gellertiella hungarica]
MPLYYYILAVPVFCLFGVLHHVVRAVFNLFPDRGYTNTSREDYSFTDDMLSGNYDITDHLVGTEYDENGYYDLHSLKNVRIACQFAVGGGVVALLVVPGLDQIFRQAVDALALAAWNLFLFRLANLELL